MFHDRGEVAVRSIQVGDRVKVVTADGSELRRVAISGPVDGDDFRVVWVCKPEEWPRETMDVNSGTSMAWPIEAVAVE